jgi:hypothetical protein
MTDKAAEDAEDDPELAGQEDDEVEMAAVEAKQAPVASKWIGPDINVEVQGCHESCDFTCGECEWEQCEVIEDDGCTCKVKFSDGTESSGIHHRHLRIANTKKRKRPS